MEENVTEKIELTVEKSEELAQKVELIKMISMGIDLDYSEEMVKSFFDQATRQESMAVLMPSHDSRKNDLLREQAKALDHFNKFIRGLRKSQNIKDQITKNQATADKISRMFI